MSFSYNLPVDGVFPSQKDAARFTLQDTLESAALLQDEEIAAVLLSNGWNDGISALAMSMVAIFGKRATEYKAGSTDAEFQWKDRVATYQNIAALARKGAIADLSAPVRIVDVPVAVPFCGKRRIEHELLGDDRRRFGRFD